MKGGRALLVAVSTSALAFTSGCGGGEGGEAGDLASLDQLPPIPLSEELRIGSVDDPDLGFTRIGSTIEVTVGDTIYVAEQGDVEIRVYDPEGRLVRRIGRQGEGPGELRSLLHWGVMGDTVWVIDFDRTTLFRRDGSLISTVRVEPLRVDIPPYFATVRPQEMLPGGRLRGGLSSYGPVGDPDLPEREIRVPKVVWDGEGAVRDTLGWEVFTLDPGATPTRMVGSYPLGQMEYPRSFPLRGPLGEDSIRVMRPPATGPDDAVMTVLRLSATGDTLVHRPFGYEPVPVAGAYRDSVMEARMESLSRFAESPAEARTALDEMILFAPHHPPVSDLTVAQDGTLWLLRAPGSPDAWAWVVLEPDGTPRGLVTTPPDTEILWSRDGVVYVEEQDELDVPWVVRYRMGGN